MTTRYLHCNGYYADQKRTLTANGGKSKLRKTSTALSVTA